MADLSRKYKININENLSEMSIGDLKKIKSNNNKILEEINDLELDRPDLLEEINIYKNKISSFNENIEDLIIQNTMILNLHEFLEDINNLKSNYINISHINLLKSDYAEFNEILSNIKPEYLLDESKKFLNEWKNLENNFKDYNNEYFSKKIDNCEKLYKNLAETPIKDLELIKSDNDKLLEEIYNFEQVNPDFKEIYKNKFRSFNEYIQDLIYQKSIVLNLEIFFEDINNLKSDYIDISHINLLKADYDEFNYFLSDIKPEFLLDESKKFLNEWKKLQNNFEDYNKDYIIKNISNNEKDFKILLKKN